MTSSHILLVDDDVALVRALTISLGAHGYQVDAARTGEEALGRAARFHPDVVVLDLGLPGMNGIEVIRALRTGSGVPIVVLTARHDATTRTEAMDAGADDYVTKPFAIEDLLARIRAAVDPPGRR